MAGLCLKRLILVTMRRADVGGGSDYEINWRKGKKKTGRVPLISPKNGILFT